MAPTEGATAVDVGAPARSKAVTPHVAGLVCAVNIAIDPQRRLSGHAIFSRVPVPELPFEFGQDFYVIVSLRGIENGPRAIDLRGEAGVLEFDPQKTEGPVTVSGGLAVVALSMINCVVHQAGPQFVTVTIDGEPLEPVFAFQVERDEQDGQND